MITQTLENPHRLEVLCGPSPCGALRAKLFAENACLKEDCEDVAMADILRVTIELCCCLVVLRNTLETLYKSSH